MDIKEIIKWFNDNKIEDLEIARKFVIVSEPSLDCDIGELIRDNDMRMNTISMFLYYYQLLEINILNYKKYSKASAYDKETLDIIYEQITYNIEEYKNIIDKIKEL